MSWFSKIVKKAFKPTNLVRIAGGVLLGVPGLMLADSMVKSRQAKKASEDAAKQSDQLSQSTTGPQTTTTFTSDATRPVVQSAATYGVQPQPAPTPTPPQGESSPPQAMKLQTSQSPYGAAVGVLGAKAAQAEQEKTPSRPANQFRAPSMQGLTFGEG